MQLKINRLNLFIGLVAFLLVVNLLVLLDLNLFYIRAVLAFLFIIAVPGLLIMLSLKIREVDFWEYLVYTIGLSISFIMFAGLAVNWILPWLHITQRPLDTIPIVICFDLFLIALGIVAYRRNEGLKYETKFPKLDTINNIFFIVPMFFPIMAILGAFILNNGGPNYLTMVMLGGIAVYVFCIVLFRDKLNKNVYPWAIWMMSLALLMSGWMRSWYVSGSDISLEYNIFDLTKNLAIWKLSNFNHTFNSLLSTTILPSLISLFSKAANPSIFKLFIPLVFALTPVVIYITAIKRFNKVLSFLAAFFFISQPTFFNWYSIPIRQEIGLFFLSLIILVIFNESKKYNYKIILIVFTFSMIVSHYTTSYIAVFLFLIVCILNLKGDKKKITLITTLIILLFGFLWYSQLSLTGDGLIGFTKNSLANFKTLSNEDTQAEGASIFDQFNIFNKTIDYRKISNDGFEQTVNIYKNNFTEQTYYDKSRYQNYNIYASYSEPYNLSSSSIAFLGYLRSLFKIIGLTSVLFGTAYLFFILKSEKFNSERGKLLIVSCILMGIISITPFITITYELTRVFIQFLIILSPVYMFGLFFICAKVKPGKRMIFVTIILIIYYLLLSNIYNEFIGGPSTPVSLTNHGPEYDRYFVNGKETTSANWLGNYADPRYALYLSNYARTRIYSAEGKNPKNKLYLDTFPQVISTNAYVYGDSANVLKGVSFKSVKGNVVSYRYPLEFLNRNKNTIYNNGGSEIFK